MVLESGAFIPPKHRSILLNLFRTRRHHRRRRDDTSKLQIEAVNIAGFISVIEGHLSTCYHTRLPVFDGEIDTVVGLLHVRQRARADSRTQSVRRRDIRRDAGQTLFHLGQHPIYSQLDLPGKPRTSRPRWTNMANFGLVTLEDIIEELIGKFTTSARIAPTA